MSALPPLSAPNVCSPEPGVISCGMLSVADLQRAHEAGIRRVVNLCQPYETPPALREALARLGMEAVSIPVGGPQDLTRENSRALAEALDCPTPVIVHCMSGNRVGALLAMKAAWIDGRDAGDALQYGLAGGLRALEGEVCRLLGID